MTPDADRPVSCDGGSCASTTLVTGRGELSYLRASGDHLFFLSRDAILSIPKAGGEVKTLLSGIGTPQEIAVDGAQVFCSSDKGIHAVPRAGGTPVTITSAPMTGIATREGEVFGCYFEDGDQEHELLRYPADAGKGIVVAKKVVACESIVAGASDVFFGGNRLFRASLSGNAKDANQIVLDDDPARKLAGDEGWIYSTTYNSTAVLRRSRDGGARAKIADSPQAIEAGDVAVDETHVHWTTGRASGGVYRAPRAGGEPEALALGQPFPQGIAVDDVAVYWTNRADGSVHRRPK